MVYTCAYFPTPESTLEQAQVAKMDHVCRKLRLQPGETVVEAGCGWGALALHMAREYGVSVKAYNISREQIAFARERAREEGLSDRVEYIEDDYRAISGKFDVFVSVGMLEHVGLDHFAEFSDAIHRSIGDTGRGLVHFIGRNYPAVFSRWIRKRIFPGGFVPSLEQSLSVLEPKNYSVLDVENLRMHYAKTLEHWLERFEKSRQQVMAMYDSKFVRAWRLYLAGSLAAFRGDTCSCSKSCSPAPSANRFSGRATRSTQTMPPSRPNPWPKKFARRFTRRFNGRMRCPDRRRRPRRIILRLGAAQRRARRRDPRSGNFSA